jgi:hypothetical protein
MDFVYGLLVGSAATAVLCCFYASKVIAKAKAEAAAIQSSVAASLDKAAKSSAEIVLISDQHQNSI